MVMIRTQSGAASFLAILFLLVQAALSVGAFVVPNTPDAVVESRDTATCDDECRIQGAIAYVRAVVSHSKADADNVPFATNCTRFESFNGGKYSKTGSSAKQLRFDLQHGVTSFAVVSSDYTTSDFRVAPNGSVIADYSVVGGLLVIPLGKGQIHEIFDFSGSEITNIMASTKIS